MSWIDDAIVKWKTIRRETEEDANTAERVGGAGEDLASGIKGHIETKNAHNTGLEDVLKLNNFTSLTIECAEAKKDSEVASLKQVKQLIAASGGGSGGSLTLQDVLDNNPIGFYASIAMLQTEMEHPIELGDEAVPNIGWVKSNIESRLAPLEEKLRDISVKTGKVIPVLGRDVFATDAFYDEICRLVTGKDDVVSINAIFIAAGVTFASESKVIAEGYGDEQIEVNILAIYNGEFIREPIEVYAQLVEVSLMIYPTIDEFGNDTGMLGIFRIGEGY